MKNSIEDINDYMPHVTIHGKKALHVLPLSVFRNIVQGKMKLSEVEDFDDFMPKVIEEWLELLNMN